MPLPANPSNPAPQPNNNNNNRPNFNDYVQTALLTASFVTQQETNNLLRQAATERKLDFWRSVARERFNTQSVMNIEDAALGLMAWDAKESKAALRRRTREHQDRPMSKEFLTPLILFGLFVMLPVLVMFGFAGGWIFIIATFDMYTSAAARNDVHMGFIYAAMAFWAWKWVPLAWKWLMIATGQMHYWWPATYDPTSDSVLCRKFPPGSTIRTTTGHTFIVRDWPLYEAERLRFNVKVEGEHVEGVTIKNHGFGKPFVPSEIIVWDNQ